MNEQSTNNSAELKEILSAFKNDIGKLDRVRSSMEKSALATKDQSDRMQDNMDSFFANLDSFDTIIRQMETLVENAVDKSVKKVSEEICGAIRKESTGMLSKLDQSARSAKSAMDNLCRKKDRLFYIIPVTISLVAIIVSFGIQWYFPHKTEYNYHLSPDMLAQIRMGKYANSALDHMNKKDREEFLKQIENGMKISLKDNVRK